MTPAGYAGGLPEFFTPKLAVMQCCDAAFMGSVKEEMCIRDRPLVVRLEGTNADLGKEILDKSGLDIISAGDVAEAARLSVARV